MIVVTGAMGFIGSNLLADLNEAGRSDVVIVDAAGSDGKWRNIAKRRFLDIVFPAEADAFLAGAKGVDVVFHLGANSSTTATDGDEVIRANFRSSAAYWNWCARTRTPFIYASSAATYGDGAFGFDDDESLAALDRLRPLNLYGWSKHAFDKWAVERAAAGEAPPFWAGLKFFNVYGPNEGHKGDMMSLVAKNAAAIGAGEAIPLFKSHRQGFADGGQLRDFVYVKDCTAAMRWLWADAKTSGLFNLGTGVARTFRSLVDAIGLALEKAVDVRYVDMPEAIRPNYQYYTQANMAKLRGAGFAAPFRTLEAGVADYVQNYLAQADVSR